MATITHAWNEYAQHEEVFLSAGRHAWMIGVRIFDNPYRKGSNAHQLWEQGYKDAAHGE